MDNRCATLSHRTPRAESEKHRMCGSRSSTNATSSGSASGSPTSAAGQAQGVAVVRIRGREGAPDWTFCRRRRFGGGKTQVAQVQSLALGRGCCSIAVLG